MPSPAATADRSRGRRAGSLRLVAAALTVLVVTGCAGQGPTSAPPAPPVPAPTTSPAYSPELCSAAARFQAAVDALVSLDVKNVGAEGVKKALQDVKTAAGDLATSARGQFGPQAAELESALASLQDAIAGLDGQAGLPTALGDIAAAFGRVEQAAKPIVDSVRKGCPAAPTAELPPSY